MPTHLITRCDETKYLVTRKYMQILMDLLNSVIPLQSNLQCELFLFPVVGSSYVTKSSTGPVSKPRIMYDLVRGTGALIADSGMSMC